METPSLDYEQQRALYQSVAEDYPEAINRKQVSEKLSLDPYYNALQVKFAYAVTCHKSQGGQWKSVFSGPGLFHRGDAFPGVPPMALYCLYQGIGATFPGKPGQTLPARGV
jgi:hypothetical protein